MPSPPQQHTSVWSGAPWEYDGSSMSLFPKSVWCCALGRGGATSILWLLEPETWSPPLLGKTLGSWHYFNGGFDTWAPLPQYPVPCCGLELSLAAHMGEWSPLLRDCIFCKQKLREMSARALGRHWQVRGLASSYCCGKEGCRGGSFGHRDMYTGREGQD